MIKLELTKEEFILISEALNMRWREFTRNGKEDKYQIAQRHLGLKLNEIAKNYNKGMNELENRQNLSS
jgi:hypothetical protein